MNKSSVNNNKIGLFKGFFYSRINAGIIFFSTLALIGIYFYYNSLDDFVIFPGNSDFIFNYYTDKANGGNSEITDYKITDSIINMQFDLKEGFVSPYVGITFAKKDTKEIDLSNYNQFEIEVKGKDTVSIGISLFSPNLYKNKTGNKELYFYNNTEISSVKKQYFLDLNHLKIPDWWYNANNISPDEKFSPDLEHTRNFNIGTAYTPKPVKENVLQIYSIRFGRNNKNLIKTLVLSELLVLIILFIIYFIIIFLKQDKKALTIEYKPVDTETESKESKNYLDYINKNFNDLNLTLEMVSNSTGVTQRRISNAIQETYGCNFKTYINQIRISESKRLLKETQLNMGEIAFKVGFNNQSHFNRVFKNVTGISPSQFRESQL